MSAKALEMNTKKVPYLFAYAYTPSLEKQPLNG